MIDELLAELTRLKEAERLLDLLYWTYIGPYKMRDLLKDKDLVKDLERHFKFDDSE